jgi:hypothetical protein
MPCSRAFVRTLFMVLLMATVAAPVASRDAPTEFGAGFPYTPDARRCTAEPRDREHLLDLWFPEDGTPLPDEPAGTPPGIITLPVGPIADEETSYAVTQTVRGFFDCLAAADFTRYLSYFTDDGVREFGPDPFTTRDACIGYLDAFPDPIPSRNPTILWAVTNVMRLPDGRAAAFVTDAGEAGMFTTYIVFEQQPDRQWLIDHTQQIPPPC